MESFKGSSLFLYSAGSEYSPSNTLLSDSSLIGGSFESISTRSIGISIIGNLGGLL